MTSITQTKNYLFSGGIVINVVLATSLSLVWNLVNVLQVITHLNYMSVLVPQNSNTLNLALLDAANLEMLPLDSVYKTLSPYLYMATPPEDGSDPPMEQLGQILALFTVQLALLPLLFIFK